MALRRVSRPAKASTSSTQVRNRAERGKAAARSNTKTAASSTRTVTVEFRAITMMSDSDVKRHDLRQCFCVMSIAAPVTTNKRTYGPMASTARKSASGPASRNATSP